MDSTADTLRDLASRVGAVVSDTFGRASLRTLSDDEVVAVMDAAGALLRGSQPPLAEVAGEVEHRSDAPDRAARMTTRYGCRNTQELLERVVRVSGRAAADLVRAGAATSASFALLTGEVLPARYPALRAAMADGAIAAAGAVLGGLPRSRWRGAPR